MTNFNLPQTPLGKFTVLLQTPNRIGEMQRTREEEGMVRKEQRKEKERRQGGRVEERGRGERHRGSV